MPTLQQLNTDPTCTERDALDYATEWSAVGAAAGGVPMPLDQFWAAGDLDRYRAAAAWWPADAPPRWQLAPLGTMLQGIVNAPGAEPWSFVRRLTHQWQRCREWLVAEGRDPALPNEDPAERRRRLGRESVARHRATAKAAAGGSPEACRLRDLHATYMAACAARRAAYDEHTPAVDAAKAAWEAAKAAT